jgi:hypothetical protein
MRKGIVHRLNLNRETLTGLDGDAAAQVLARAVKGARLPHTADRTCGTCFSCPNNPSFCFTC